MEDITGLLNSIIRNMEYIRLLLEAGHKYIPPLNTFNLVMNKLNRLKVMLEDNYLTPEQIMEVVRKLETPIEPNEPIFVDMENPVNKFDLL